MTQRNLLLISNSTLHGSGYLDYCEPQLRGALGNVSRVLFIPFALFDRDAYTATARERFERMGYAVDGLHAVPDPRAAVEAAEAVFVGGGNTFRLLKTLQDLELLEPLRRRVADGMVYTGASAGSNLACPTIRTTNDMPIVEPRSFDALGLVPFQINPHYLDPDPSSTHKGETREQRLCEYLEENDRVVIGLREGTMLRVEGAQMRLEGEGKARIFTRGRKVGEVEVREVETGTSLDDLLG